MRLLLRKGLTGKLEHLSGEWVEVDPSFLSENQYNVVSGDESLRILDANVIKVEDDLRRGAGRCLWCGKIVHSPEEAENHFKEEEAKKCAHVNADTPCMYKREAIDASSKSIGKTEDGNYVRTITENFHYECYYPEGNAGRECTHMEHRPHGIKWFTEENTYFLKYPEGLRQGYVDLSKIDRSKWEVVGWMNDSIAYKKRFGSYRLTVKLRLKSSTSVIDWDKGGVYEVDKICLDNCNMSVWFRYDRGDGTVVSFDGVGGSPQMYRRILCRKDSAAARDAEKKALAVILGILEPESVMDGRNNNKTEVTENG